MKLDIDFLRTWAGVDDWEETHLNTLNKIINERIITI